MAWRSKASYSLLVTAGKLFTSKLSSRCFFLGGGGLCAVEKLGILGEMGSAEPRFDRSKSESCFFASSDEKAHLKRCRAMTSTFPIMTASQKRQVAWKPCKYSWLSKNCRIPPNFRPLRRFGACHSGRGEKEDIIIFSYEYKHSSSGTGIITPFGPIPRMITRFGQTHRVITRFGKPYQPRLLRAVPH